MRDRFSRLLTGFSALAARDSTSTAPLTARFRTLLEQSGEHRTRADALEYKQALDDHARFQTTLGGYNEAVERYRVQQERFADDFNLLQVMRLTGKEIRHSMVLAWLLDRDLRKLGTHAQGNLGFRLFLTEFSDLGLPLDYADCNYWVRREVAGDESIVDVEIACRGKFIIHIENKIWASEGGDDQTVREWGDLQRRAKELEVSPGQFHALFLTPQGMKPVCHEFEVIRWGRVVKVLISFAEWAKPPDVKLFAKHYAEALRRFIIIQDTSEERDVKATDE